MLSTPIMQPASRTPPMQARTLSLKSISSRLAARVPVHAGAGQGNAHKQQQSNKKAAAGGGFQLLAALVAFFQAESEKLADHRFVSAPFQDLARKQKDERHRDHVADDGNDVGAPQRQTKNYAIGDCAAQFDQGNHRNKKYSQVFLKHSSTSQLIDVKFAYEFYYTRIRDMPQDLHHRFCVKFMSSGQDAGFRYKKGAKPCGIWYNYNIHAHRIRKNDGTTTAGGGTGCSV